jgi:hypothetical protein
MAVGRQGVFKYTRTESGEYSITTKLIARTETLVDPILSDVDDLLESPFGNPPPTTIHITTVIDRTVAVLERIEEISQSGEVSWEPTVVWEPYYVGLILSKNADK